ncbi:2-dehydro-3-deoxyphosphooctonate aldolase [Candidatus Vecturithrix granuli]|uniref:3-deoxy-8-phosphooctulonate synthase n=1 Tax=Vecturithrix granuli TaxID=1499967 RepID=A0A081C6K4_VECG1|nr:2-dehydro-3-deoxyphosphooctonate aldolase [Candidatus Vecturithrix granuli]
MILIAGPCVIEKDPSIAFQTAEQLKNLTEDLQMPYIFKASYDKANRSSLSSYRGVGLEKGLDILDEVKQQFGLPILTDVHSPAEAHIAAEVVDILQIPAFLCRQTDLLVAAAKTGKIVNIKKGQFLAPSDIEYCIRKVTDSGNKNVLVTERGFAFGYGNLVSDMRAIPIMQRFGYPVIFDATHSVQLPGGVGGASSGERQFVETLARAAVAAGANGLFLEVHPQPDLAPCDGPNMITPDTTRALLTVCQAIFQIVHQ